MLHALRGVWGKVFTSNYVTVETTLLLSTRLGSQMPHSFSRFLKESGLSEVVIDDATHEQSLELFIRDSAFSLTDAAAATLSESFKIDRVATYDQRTFRGRFREIIGKKYFESLSGKDGDEVKEWLTKQ